MEAFLPLFIALFASVFFASFFTRLHLPWVVALILGGIIIGPDVFGVFHVDATVSFIGQLGLIFLMFMAGLETRLSSFRENGGKMFGTALLNGGIPFLAGLGIGFAFGFGTTASILLGVIFISSSIAVVVPTLESLGLFQSRLGKTIAGAAIIEDVASLLILSVVLQTVSPTTSLPLPLFYALLALILAFLRFALPRLERILQFGRKNATALFQQELRSVFVVLVGTVLVFELLGLHPIIAGFFAGLVLSDNVRSDGLVEKLRTIAYGIFIPIFFVIVGAQTDIAVLGHAGTALALVVVVVVGSLTSKFASGWLAGRLTGLSNRASLIIGSATIPQLSTTLAVVFTGVSLGILDETLTTAMVILSILTVLVSPILVQYFTRKMPQIHIGGEKK